MKEVFGSIIRIFGFLLILPLVIAAFIAFQNQILSLPVNKEVWVLWGAGSYIALNLFIYDFKDVYNFGKSIIENLMAFFKPAGYLIPFYSIVFIFIYVIAIIFWHGPSLQPYFLFVLSFTIAMHLILTAHDIYGSDNSILKAQYFFIFGILLIVNLIVISLLLAWAIPDYSLIAFLKSLASETTRLYTMIYKILFVDR